MEEKKEIVDTGLEMMAVRLSMLRLDSKKQQKAVANDLDIKPQVLAYYEKGKRHPDFKTLCSLARYYNVSVDYLLGNSEYKNSTQKSLNELLSEKLEIPSESSNELTYLFDQYLEIIKLLFHPFLPYGTHNKGSYADLQQLTKKLESCIVWLHDYMMQSIDDINIQHNLIMATADGNHDLVKTLENSHKNDRNNSLYFMQFNSSLNHYISSLQDEHRKLLEDSI